MKTQVEFRSHKFPPFEHEEDSMNPGIWGKRLAEYLRTQLLKRGVEVAKIYPEDWGWAITLKNSSPAWIGCGHQHGDEDQFLCFIETSKKLDLPNQLANLLNDILTTDPEIREVRWLEK